jgi:hypothetical protein
MGTGIGAATLINWEVNEQPSRCNVRFSRLNPENEGRTR